METKKYMYRVLVLEGFIQKFEILRVTDKTVYWTTKLGRYDYQRKVSDFHNWFETLEEAVTFIMNSIEEERNRAKATVKRLEAKRTQIIQKFKVNAQTLDGSNVEGYKIAFVELGEVELEVHNRENKKK